MPSRRLFTIVKRYKGSGGKAGCFEHQRLSDARGLLQAINLSLDRYEPLVLPCGKNHHVSELLKHRLDLCDTLIDVMQLGSHAVGATFSCDEAADSTIEA